MTQRPANSRVRHGDPTCADYGCKREECLQARRDKKKRNRFLLDTGRPGYVPADRAAAHLRKFRNAGFQDKEILTLIPIARRTFYRAMRGEPLSRTSEQKILSVPVPAPAGHVRTTAVVAATGTHRRLQALVWLGWPQLELERRLGVCPGWIARSLRGQGVRLNLASQVQRLYDDLWLVRPETDGVDAGLAEAARTYARGLAWVGPLAWDDATMDDPQAVPVADAVGPVATEGDNLADRWIHGESVLLKPADRKKVLQHLFEWTSDTPEEIAGRLEMSLDAMWQAWSRLKKQARDEGRPEPWRRVYVPRERDLKQNEMEEAA